MNFFSRLTTAGKAVLVFLVVGVIGSALYFTGATKALGSLGSSSKDVTLVVNTYTGFESVLLANGGMKGSDDSYLYKNYGIKLNVVCIDDPTVLQSALKSGEAQIGYTTLDVLPIAMGSESTMASDGYKYWALLNHSAGADILVADKSVQTTADLKGKKVAYAEGTASHTLLLNILETSQLTMNDIVPVKVESGIEASNVFKTLSANGACIWSPDDAEALAAVNGSHVLASTKDANMLISDGLIAKKEWLDNNKELAAHILEGILWANSEISHNEEATKKAAQLFAAGFDSDVDFALATSKNINFSTLQDELNWFGLNSDYTGMTGERIYTKMSRTYTELGLTKSVLPWSKVVYTDVIEMLAAENKLENYQDASSTAIKEFTEATAQQQEAKAISSKKVTIKFPTAGYALDNTAQAVIDKEFVDIIKEFANARIRIVGNTDNTGNYNSNVALSEKRAQAVVDYLVKEYNIDKQRFIVVGNGPKKAIEAGVNGASDEYRTTDLELIRE